MGHTAKPTLRVDIYCDWCKKSHSYSIAEVLEAWSDRDEDGEPHLLCRGGRHRSRPLGEEHVEDALAQFVRKVVEGTKAD